jgi:hypothetical protein
MMSLFRNIAIAGFLLFFASNSFAELDPELAASTTKNESGAYVDASASVGWGKGGHGYSDGAGFSFGVAPGFALSNDRWQRREFDLDVGVGFSPSVNHAFFVMPRIGFGSYLGSGIFSALKLGLGASINELKKDESTHGADGETKSESEFGYQIAYSVTVPISQGGASVIWGIKYLNCGEFNMFGASVGVRLGL